MMSNYHKLRFFEFSSRLLFGFILFPFMISIFGIDDPPYINHFHEALALFYYVVLALFIPNQIRRVALFGYDIKDICRRIVIIKWALLAITLLLFACSVFLLEGDYSKTPGTGFNKTMNYYVRQGSQLIPANIGFMMVTFLIFYISETLRVTENLKEEQKLTV